MVFLLEGLAVIIAENLKRNNNPQWVGWSPLVHLFQIVVHLKRTPTDQCANCIGPNGRLSASLVRNAFSGFKERNSTTLELTKVDRGRIAAVHELRQFIL